MEGRHKGTFYNSLFHRDLSKSDLSKIQRRAPPEPTDVGKRGRNVAASKQKSAPATTKMPAPSKPQKRTTPAGKKRRAPAAEPQKPAPSKQQKRTIPARKQKASPIDSQKPARSQKQKHSTSTPSQNQKRATPIRKQKSPPVEVPTPSQSHKRTVPATKTSHVELQRPAPPQSQERVAQEQGSVLAEAQEPVPSQTKQTVVAVMKERPLSHTRHSAGSKSPQDSQTSSTKLVYVTLRVQGMSFHLSDEEQEVDVLPFDSPVESKEAVSTVEALPESSKSPLKLPAKPQMASEQPNTPILPKFPDITSCGIPSISPPPKICNYAGSPIEFDGISFSDPMASPYIQEEQKLPTLVDKRELAPPSTEVPCEVNVARTQNSLPIDCDRTTKRFRMTLYDGNSILTSPLDALATYPSISLMDDFEHIGLLGSNQKLIPSPVDRLTAPEDRVPPPSLPISRTSSCGSFPTPLKDFSLSPDGLLPFVGFTDALTSALGLHEDRDEESDLSYTHDDAMPFTNNDCDGDDLFPSGSIFGMTLDTFERQIYD